MSEMCPLCNKNIGVTISDLPAEESDFKHRKIYKCPRCGYYLYNDLISLKDVDLIKLSCVIRNQSERNSEPIQLTGINHINQYINQFPDFSIVQKMRNILLHISNHSKYPGDSVQIAPSEDYPLFWTMNYKELYYYFEYLSEEELLEDINTENSIVRAILTPKGWDYIAMNPPVIGNQVFIAMSFDKDMDEVYDKAILPAVKSAGYDPCRVDRIEHTGQINDKIIMEIRNSCFLIADFTQNKSGVYFEAGFGLGQGKIVIWCVNKDDIHKVHFDTHQYSHICWQDINDFKEKLYNRICALMGKYENNL